MIHSDIKGWVPTALINSTVKAVLPNVIIALMKHVAANPE